MKKQTKQVTEYILEPQDIVLMKNCLNYCYHRIKKHNKFIPDYLDNIQRLRREFGIVYNKGGYTLTPGGKGLNNLLDKL